jgi:hypothetical protein
MSKSFTTAPKPKLLTSDAIEAFERGGPGHDTQTHIPTNVGKMEPAKVERTRRLSIDIPESWHRRFKTACSRSDTKMVVEVLEFIKRRTHELEVQPQD